MVVRETAILAAPTEQIGQRLVLEVCIVAGALVYVLVHLLALPWSLGAAAVIRGEPEGVKRRTRGWRIFLVGTLATVFVSVVGALVGWSWLLV
jgi:hypothetical protein